MQTVSVAEAAENFAELVSKLDSEPLLVLDGEQEVAIITSPAAAERERQRRWEALWETAARASKELETNLKKEGITVEEFLEDVLRKDS